MAPALSPYQSLYVHIPFCHSKCSYCAFASQVPRAGEMEAYPALLAQELRLRAPSFPARGARTIYIGGGTPLLLPPRTLEAVLRLVADTAYGPGTEEWSIEGRPSNVDGERASLLAGCGVNRVTLGVQSPHAAITERLGRPDAPQELVRACALLREAGIDNLGIDLILGLPGERPAPFVHALQELLAHGIGHVSAYFLKLEPGTPLAAAVSSGSVRLPREERVLRTLHGLRRMLVRSGFRQYEVSNFALPGQHSRHNWLTWHYGTYYGLGAAAVGCDGAVRSTNPATFIQYRKWVREGDATHLQQERLDSTIRVRERIMLGLRTTEGLDMQQLATEENYDLVAQSGPGLAHMQEAGLVRILDGNRLRATLKGWLWLDEVLIQLLPD